MSKKAGVLNLERSELKKRAGKKVQLDSGREILVHSDENEELVEIVEPGGEVVMTVRLCDKGPVVTIRGAHLKLKSTETVALEGKKIRIKATEEAVVESKGDLKIDSSKKMDIHSKDDIRVVGKMIHLN
jgi:hypothetical protein